MTIFPPVPSSSLMALTVIFRGSSFPNPFLVNEVRRNFSRASFEFDINSRSQTSLCQISEIETSLLGRRLTCESIGYRAKCECSVRSSRATATHLLITILRRRVTSLCMRCCASGKCVQCAKVGVLPGSQTWSFGRHPRPVQRRQKRRRGSVRAERRVSASGTRPAMKGLAGERSG